MSVTQRSINVSSIPCLFSKEEKRKKKNLSSGLSFQLKSNKQGMEAFLKNLSQVI